MAENLEKLLARARTGDDQAFKTVLAELYTPAYAYAYFRLGSHDEAAKAMPEIFERLAALLAETPAPARNPESYVLSIARNVVIDQWRAKGRVLSEAGAPKAGGAAHGKPRDRKDIASLIALLPGDQQEIIVHKFIRGDMDADTALYMGRTEMTIRKSTPEALGRLMGLKNGKDPGDADRVVIVRDVLKMLENGSSPKEIRAAFAEHEKTVFELFSLFEVLHREGAEVEPPHGLLAEILAKLPAAATAAVRPHAHASGPGGAARPTVRTSRGMVWWIGLVLGVGLFAAAAIWFFRPAVFTVGPLNSTREPVDGSAVSGSIDTPGTALETDANDPGLPESFDENLDGDSTLTEDLEADTADPAEDEPAADEAAADETATTIDESL